MPGSVSFSHKVKAESRMEKLQKMVAQPIFRVLSCHLGVGELQGKKVYILFLVWQTSLGLDFPICIMGGRLSEEATSSDHLCPPTTVKYSLRQPKISPIFVPLWTSNYICVRHFASIFHIFYLIRPVWQEALLLFPFYR